jgi:hypothetical protein
MNNRFNEADAASSTSIAYVILDGKGAGKDD